MDLEVLISESPAVRRELANFELMQIFISDRSIGDLADRQYDRMGEQFRTNNIPLHVVLSPEGKELARITYRPTMTDEDYTAFLRRGLDGMEKRKAK